MADETTDSTPAGDAMAVDVELDKGHNGDGAPSHELSHDERPHDHDNDNDNNNPLDDDHDDHDHDDSPDNPPDRDDPPGPRAQRLQALFASSLAHTLARVSWANFAACYPTAAARSPAALQTVHTALVARLQELCAAEFAAVLRQRQVVARLNALEGLGVAARRRREEATAEAAAKQAAEEAAEEAKETRPPQSTRPRRPTRPLPPPPTPPHTLPPTTILAAHLAPQRRAQAADLAARLRASQQANSVRFARLAAQQAEAARLVAALEQALADAAAAAALLDGDAGVGDVPLAVLARETRAAEQEMEV